MKFLKILTLLISLIILVSCARKEEAAGEHSKVLAQSTTPEMKKVEIDIEGMTCEIGCARTIQSKLSKKEGVTLAQVNFSEKKGLVEYDAQIISEKEIIETVEKIADGELYKVTNTSEKE